MFEYYTIVDCTVHGQCSGGVKKLSKNKFAL